MKRPARPAPLSSFLHPSAFILPPYSPLAFILIPANPGEPAVVRSIDREDSTRCGGASGGMLRASGEPSSSDLAFGPGIGTNAQVRRSTAGDAFHPSTPSSDPRRRAGGGRE